MQDPNPNRDAFIPRFPFIPSDNLCLSIYQVVDINLKDMSNLHRAR
jgi:hypothetical protein